MSTVTCFFIEHNERTRYWLRRYSNSEKRPCLSDQSYCDGQILLGDFEARNKPSKPVRSDPMWPLVCDKCKRTFEPTDQWQLFPKSLYVAAGGDGGEFSLDNAEPGAMWDATWWPDRGPDGRALVVKLPGGNDWHIDGLSTQGGRWKRTGEVPKITVRPSILVPGYHGFLTDGVLKSC